MIFLYGSGGQEGQEESSCGGAGVWQNAGLVQNRRGTVNSHTMHANMVHRMTTRCSICLLVVYVTTMAGVHKGFNDLGASVLLSFLCINISLINIASSCVTVTFTLITIERVEQKGSIPFVWSLLCCYFSKCDNATDVRTSHSSVCEKEVILGSLLS